MRKLALLAIFLALPLSVFAADAKPADVKPATQSVAPVAISDASKAAIAMAERDILNIGRQMDDLRAKFQSLAEQDQAAQKAMQAAVQAAYESIGDPKREKYDFSADSVSFTLKPAKPEVPATPAKK